MESGGWICVLRWKLGCIHPVTGGGTDFWGSYPWVPQIHQQLTEDSPTTCFTSTPAPRQKQRIPRHQTWEHLENPTHWESISRRVWSQSSPPWKRWWDRGVWHGGWLLDSCTKQKRMWQSVDTTTAVRLGFICQKLKTIPLAQVQRCCGLLYNTHDVPLVCLPEAQLSRRLATQEFVLRHNQWGQLSQLMVVVLEGLSSNQWLMQHQEEKGRPTYGICMMNYTAYPIWMEKLSTTQLSCYLRCACPIWAGGNNTCEGQPRKPS
jgi:hypothetical protein